MCVRRSFERAASLVEALISSVQQDGLSDVRIRATCRLLTVSCNSIVSDL